MSDTGTTKLALDQPGSAGMGTLRLSSGFAAVVVIIVIAIVVYGKLHLYAFPQFATFHAGFVFVVDAIVAFLLFGQFIYRRLLCYAVLAAAYLFSSLITVPFLLSFPGGLVPHGIVLGSTQSSIWVWHLWHIGFPSIVALSLVSSMSEDTVRPQRIAPSIGLAVTTVLCAVLLVSIMVTLFHDHLPVLITTGPKPLTTAFYIVGGLTATVTALTLVLALHRARRRTVLHLWLVVVLTAYLADVTASLGAYDRYTVGWYFGRVESMIAAAVLLLVFLTEINRLYRRLGATIIELFGTNRQLAAMVEEKEKYQDQLEDMVATRTAELSASNRELESYSYSIAHDLRGPLRSLVSFSQILEQEAANKLDKQELENIERIIKSGKQMSDTIDDILKLSRISRGTVSKETFDISLICQELTRQLDERNQNRKINWHIDDELIIEGDRSLVRVMMQNLLENAWKFTCSTANPCIEVGQAIIDGVKTVYVRDNGIGFDMQYANKIYLPFHRLNPKEFDGTGIGLAIVQRVVGRHGGHLWADSKPGKGATFYFSLTTDKTSVEPGNRNLHVREQSESKPSRTLQ